jgi:hypothetical protein
MTLQRKSQNPAAPESSPIEPEPLSIRRGFTATLEEVRRISQELRDRFDHRHGPPTHSDSRP